MVTKVNLGCLVVVAGALLGACDGGGEDAVPSPGAVVDREVPGTSRREVVSNVLGVSLAYTKDGASRKRSSRSTGRGASPCGALPTRPRRRSIAGS
jgi:hypothetical protein